MTRTQKSPRRHRQISALGAAGTLVGGAGSALLLALASSPASATGATLVIDTLADGPSNPSDCTTPVAGSCSLRDAIDAANDGDLITFASGLTGTITLNVGDELYFDTNATLRGPGSSSLTIDAAGLSRVFYVCGGPATTIEGVTLTGGHASKGGALYDECGNGLTLIDVVVTGNTSSGGGGGIYARGPVTLTDSVVSNNYAYNGQGGGGVIGGTLTMTRSRVTGNNSVNGGGGLYLGGDVSIVSSEVSGNSAQFCGGGLYIASTQKNIVIQDSLFANNTANGYGGGIDVDGNDNYTTIANTTINGNSARHGGAGVHVDGSNGLEVLMSTITGNSATGSGTSLYGGGGLRIGTPSGQFTRTDITIDGSIIAGNTAAAGAADIQDASATPPPPNVHANSSLIGDVDPVITLVGSGNIRGNDPQVAPLAANGGFTRTMALLPTSPALDAGPAVIPSFPLNANDQRGAGYPRVVGTRADIGAFEVQAEPEPTTTTTAPGPVTPTFTG